MIVDPQLRANPERLAVLRRLGLMDSPPEPAFDRLVRLAARFLEAPVSLITLVDDHRQFFKAAVGLQGEIAVRRETPLTHCFCKHVVVRGQPLVVNDARADPLVCDNPAIAEYSVVAYLGMPIRSAEGHVLGSFCVIDARPRAWTTPEIELLGELAQVAMTEIAARQRDQGAVAALEASEDRLRKVLGWADCLVWEAEVECTPEDWSWKFAIHPSGLGHRIFGERAPSQGVGLWNRFAVPEAAEMDARSREAIMSGKPGYTQEFRIIREGQETWLREVVTIARRAGRYWLVGVATDITPRRRAEELAESSRRELGRINVLQRAILDGTVQGIIATSLDGTIQEFNAGAERMLGYARSEMIGRETPLKFHRASEVAARASELGALLGRPVQPGFEVFVALARLGQAEAREWTFVRKDGSLLPVLVSVTALRDEAGLITGFLGVASDVSPAKRAAAERRHSHERLMTIFHAVNEGLVLQDTDGAILECNHAAEVILGLTRADMKGRTSHDPHWRAVREDGSDFPADEHPVSVTLRTAAPQRGVIMGVHRPDGSVAWIEINSEPVRDERGVVTSVVCSFADVTERRQMQVDLERVRNEAVRASRLKSEFLANMSHEIRTPMNGVIGLASILGGTALDHAQREMVRLIQSSGESLLAVLNDILDFSKIEAGKLAIERAPFDLRALLGEVMALLAPRAGQKGIVIMSEIDAAVPARLEGDALRIRQIVTNLLGNAVKFTEHGSVALHASAAAGAAEGAVRVRISVRDTGPGIPAELQAALFRPFVQADGSHTRRHGGTGLGLSISRQLAELMGGHLGLRSALGEGSEFWFELEMPVGPAVAADLAGAAADRDVGALTLASAICGPSLHVLLADDNPTNQLVAESILTSLGHTVVVVRDGQEVLTALARERFDLLLLDCQMPVLDGFETARRIRSGAAVGVPRDIPIVAMTAYAMASDREACLAAGMNDHVSKPVRVLDLQAALERNRPAGAASAAAQADVPPASPEPIPPVLDPGVLRELRGMRDIDTGMSLLLRLRQVHRAAGEASRAELDQALAGRDATRVVAVAHRLAGAYASLGAVQAAGALGQLEGAARTSSWNEVEGAARIVRDEVARAETAIAQLE